MNCSLSEGCQCDKFCEYSRACLWHVIKIKAPKSRWHRLMKRVVKLWLTGYCELSDNCRSCQKRQCSLKRILDEVINFVPKVVPNEFLHPKYGIITSYISPSGSSKGNRKKIIILMRDGCCQQCGSTKELTIDHIKERSKGGSLKRPENLQVLCATCNQLKSNPSHEKYKTNL